ncbi:MAG TPA: citrate/2-methylcitrate synthase [Anaerolineae bacterium]|nr:citrate/2-methylcitrate synthase [Anaerolineae bacterium]
MSQPPVEIKRGLEGVVFTETNLSSIDGDAGKLTYCGYDIVDLAAHTSYEEAAFLLWYQRLPAVDELRMLSNWLRANRTLPKMVWGIMHSLPEKATPMEGLRTIASTLSIFDRACIHEELGGASLCRSVSLTAKLPTIVASFDRLRRSRPPLEPRSDLGHAANLLWMLNGVEPHELSVTALETYLVLLAEHGMNASTFSARVTASTLGDVYSAVVTALGTLKGPLHGGAAQKAMEDLMEIGSLENVDPWFEGKMAAGQRMFGFGHRVYKAEDPRATILRELAHKAALGSGMTRWYDIAARLEERVLASPYFKERKLYTNVDFFTAPLLAALGIPVDLFIPMFAVARIAGWTAHVLEQEQHNRLIRPRAYYAGPRDRAWVHMEVRTPAVEADPESKSVAGRLAGCPAALRVPPQFWPDSLPDAG